VVIDEGLERLVDGKCTLWSIVWITLQTSVDESRQTLGKLGPQTSQIGWIILTNGHEESRRKFTLKGWGAAEQAVKNSAKSPYIAPLIGDCRTHDLFG
jgi:hypothetical protein